MIRLLSERSNEMKKGNNMMGIMLPVAVILMSASLLAGNLETDVRAEEIPENAAEYKNGWVSSDIDRQYVYCVGSVSKVYATAAVMQLVEEGKVDLDGPVTDYIPGFRIADPRYRDITVRMLMNHTSGIMGTSRKGMLLLGDVDTCHMDHLLETLSGQRLKADPGKYAAYCNDGFDLLGLITENVSGMSFSDYVKEKLAAPSGGTMTGTGYDMTFSKDLAPAFSSDYRRCEPGGSMSPGAGGVYGTASDVAKFGSGFFSGNDTLLSSRSKTEMARRWNDSDEYMDGCGLGWDSVNDEPFESAGVKVLGKGGDDGLNHAYLMVAPDEDISIAVLSNEGSSAINGILSGEILRVCLEEKGIAFEEEKTEISQAVDLIPESYDEYAGSYVVASERGECINRISFPDHRYMHVEEIGPYKTTCKDYVLTTDGRFASLAWEVADSGVDDMRISVNPVYISFAKDEDGKVFIIAEANNVYPGLGNYENDAYAGEKMEENPVSSEILSAWKEFSKNRFFMENEIWSSENYEYAVASIVLPDDYPGYMFAETGMGTRLLKIVDKEHAAAFQTIPSSRSRDLIDVAIERSEEGMKMCLSDGVDYIWEKDVPEFDLSLRQIPLETGKAAWFHIGDGAKNAEVAIDSRPERSSVRVYNKFGEVLYTTAVKDMTDVLPMPEDGMVVFAGETGDSITLK